MGSRTVPAQNGSDHLRPSTITAAAKPHETATSMIAARTRHPLREALEANTTAMYTADGPINRVDMKSSARPARLRFSGMVDATIATRPRRPSSEAFNPAAATDIHLCTRRELPERSKTMAMNSGRVTSNISHGVASVGTGYVAGASPRDRSSATAD